MKKLMLAATVLLALPGLAAAWHEPPPPADLVSVPEAGVFWPYTGRDYTATPTDPINLIFLGDVDPRLIRQGLLALDGDRTAFGFPNQLPFNCTWSDAIGSPQTGYSDEAGWEGSAVQLECGEYATVRAHLRLFRQGHYTLGGAHFEVQVPGTSSHYVLSWEMPELLVKVDLARSGLLVAPPGETLPITTAPEYRDVPYQVLNGVPDALRAALGLPTGDLTSNVPIPNDGVATILTLRGELDRTASEVVVEFDHPFDRAIPRPFCSTGPGDFVYVSGSLHMVHRVRTDDEGRYGARFLAAGTLQVVPIDPWSGQPVGEPVVATVWEAHRSLMTDHLQAAALTSVQALLTDPTQSLVEKLWAGYLKHHVLQESCGF
jgi:hypothetical protein